MANAPVPVSNASQLDKDATNNNALWYTFRGIGRAYLVRRGSLAAGNADTSGVHGYLTIEQAYTNPNSINAASQATASSWDADASLPVGGGTIGVVMTVNVTAPTSPGQPPSASTPQNPTTAALNNANPLAGLFQANIWLRVGEFALGAILICAGLAKLAESNKTVQTVVSATPIGRIGKIAGVI